MKLFRHKYENVWLKSFECNSMLNSKGFMKNDYMLYLLFIIIIENV